MENRLHQMTNHADGEIYYFCNEACALGFEEDLMGGDYDDPEEVEDANMEEAIDSGCDFCTKRLEKNA